MALVSRYYGYEQMAEIAQLLHAASVACAVMTFKGHIGAGKTTLIKAFLRCLGITDVITSPTFTYMACYKTASGRPVYHFDLYRIKNVAQFESMGFSEYLYEPGALVLIEWPEIIEPFLGNLVCKVVLDYTPDHQQRVITLTTQGEIREL